MGQIDAVPPRLYLAQVHEDHHEGSRLIGVYSTSEKASEAIEALIRYRTDDERTLYSRTGDRQALDVIWRCRSRHSGGFFYDSAGFTVTEVSVDEEISD